MCFNYWGGAWTEKLLIANLKLKLNLIKKKTNVVEWTYNVYICPIVNMSFVMPYSYVWGYRMFPYRNSWMMRKIFLAVGMKIIIILPHRNLYGFLSLKCLNILCNYISILSKLLTFWPSSSHICETKLAYNWLTL